MIDFCFKLGINLRPEQFPVSYMYLGVALSRLNDFSNGSIAYQRSIEMNPNDHLVRLNYAITLANHGQYDEAHQQLEKFDSIFVRFHF